MYRAIIFFSFLFLFQCASPEKSLEKGNYNQAYKSALSALKKGKSYAKNQKILIQALDEIVAKKTVEKDRLQNATDLKSKEKSIQVNQDVQKKIVNLKPMTMYNLNNKRFVTAANPSGLSSNKTFFHYFQEGKTITGNYQGGAIIVGRIVGKQVGEYGIELLYNCLTTEGELKAGTSKGTVAKNEKGLLEINLNWAWLTGDQANGKSKYIETVENPS